jgi:hypothetical protein
MVEMRKALAAMMILCLGLLGACGGGEEEDEAREGALARPDDKAKESKARAEDVIQVGEHQARSTTDCANPTFNAFWPKTPKSFREGVGAAQNVVEADVVEVKPAEDLVIQASQEPGGSYRIPRQQVVFRVAKKHKGALNEGQNTTLIKTGTDCQFIEGDPPYKVGEKHLLLLEGTPGGSQAILSPEARFRVLPDGTLESASKHRDLVRDAAGRKLQDLNLPELVGGAAGGVVPTGVPGVPN